jgi:ATP-dependent HslUV protease ATP-binding subunit HslU
VTIVVEEQPQAQSRGSALLPQEVVRELTRFIVGQDDAKRALAIALRNRWRRMQLPAGPLREEVIPKNILMIGPTGVGKTEVARRLAKLLDAPFIKVEATKYTEVGFHGRDVDQIIRDLVDLAITQTKQKTLARRKQEVQRIVEDRLLDLLIGEDGGGVSRETFRQMLQRGELDQREIEFEAPDAPRKMSPGGVLGSGGADPNMAFGLLNDIFVRVERHAGGGIGGKKKKRCTVAEARPLLEEQEADKLVTQEQVVKDALYAVENDGIVFIDEIDKLCKPKDSFYHGADASSEGVQRDLLPIIEGCSISTKHGNVNTDKILFICSGAFHSCKPSDLLAELQGRLPIRVELKGLTEHDLYRILTEPETNLLLQQRELLKTEGLEVTFDESAIREIARVAAEVNHSVENIGARRLHTIIERVMEEVSFDWSGVPDKKVVIDAAYVRQRVEPLLKKTDLSRFVL